METELLLRVRCASAAVEGGVSAQSWKNQQHSTAQHRATTGNKVQHSAAQHSTAQHSTAQHSTAQHSTAQRSAAQCSTVQHSTAHLRLEMLIVPVQSICQILKQYGVIVRVTQGYKAVMQEEVVVVTVPVRQQYLLTLWDVLPGY